MTLTADINTIATDYERATAVFLAAAADVTPTTLDLHHADGWSARQVIHHVADSEAQSYARLRRLLAEPDPVIQGYDEAAWACAPNLGYTELPVENSLAVFAAVRASSLDIIRRLSPEDLQLAGTHSESGPYSVSRWLEVYSGHPVEHADQLRRALRCEE
jgi:hypothetical protein